jgi:anti-anti-sigma regulatory factor
LETCPSDKGPHHGGNALAREQDINRRERFMTGVAVNLEGTDGAVPACPPTVELAAELNFVAARALHARLMDLREAEGVLLDARKVETLSTAAVLVLVSFLNARAQMTPPAAVLSPTGAFVDAFSELGLFGNLMRMEFRT